MSTDDASNTKQTLALERRLSNVERDRFAIGAADEAAVVVCALGTRGLQLRHRLDERTGKQQQ
jgi:hypothetical protein